MSFGGLWEYEEELEEREGEGNNVDTLLTCEIPKE